MNYKYYIVEGSGPIADAIESFSKDADAFEKHVNEVVNKFGANGVYISIHQISGLSFNGSPPEGWIKVKKTSDGYRPPAKDKETCKYLYSVSRPSSFSLPASQVWAADGRLYFPKFEKVGEVTVWVVPEGSKFDETGCRQIKTSEYHMLKGD